MLVGFINEISEFLFNFIEKFGKIYAVPKESWTYHTKEEYLKEGMEEELAKKLVETQNKMKNIVESASNLMFSE